MKIAKILAGAALAICLSSCGAMKSTPSAEMETLVIQAVENQEFTMEVNRIIPMRGRPRTDFGYYIQVKDGELDSYLPYFGVSRVVSYNEGNPLNFKAPIEAYNCYQNRKGAFIFEFVATNPNSQRLPVYYQLTVWDNGNASLVVNSTGRDPMSYSGYLAEER